MIHFWFIKTKSYVRPDYNPKLFIFYIVILSAELISREIHYIYEKFNQYTRHYLSNTGPTVSSTFSQMLLIFNVFPHKYHCEYQAQIYKGHLKTNYINCSVHKMISVVGHYYFANICLITSPEI